MEGLITVGILLAIGLPIAAIVVATTAIGRAQALEIDLKDLRRQVAQLKATLSKAAQTPAKTVTPEVARPSVTSTPKATPTPPPPPAAEKPKPPIASAASTPPTPAPTPSPASDEDELILEPVEPDEVITPIAAKGEHHEAVKSADEPSAAHAIAKAISGGQAAEVAWDRGAKPQAAKTNTSDASRSSSRASLEQKLGAQLPIWIGGIALALAGVFMVRYATQHGVLTPLVRALMTAGAGLIAVVIAEVIRRSYAQIAQGLAAAGVAAWYAATFAAVNLYHLMSPGAGFALIGVITVIAVVLSLRHGPFVALLGIVGGFLMPGLLGVDHFSATQLFAYLLVLEVAMTLLTRRRRWWPLTLVTMLFAFGWAGVWIGFWFDPAHATLVGLFVLSSVVAFVVATFNSRDEFANAPIMMLMPYAAMIAGLLLSGWLIHVSELDPVQWVYLGVLAGAALLLARLRDGYFGIACAAVIATAGLLLLTAMDAGSKLPAIYSTVMFNFGAIFAAGSALCMIGKRDFAGRGRFAELSVASALAFMLIDYHFNPGSSLTSMPWWAIASLLSAAYIAGSVVMTLRRTVAHGERALAAMLIGASAFAALALTLRYETLWLTVTLAIEVLVIAAVAWRLHVPRLRPLVQIGGVIVAVRLLANPFVLQYHFAAAPIFNGIWVLYGLPLICLGAAAWISRRDLQFVTAKALDSISLAIGFAMTTLLVRHGFHADHMLPIDIDIYESTAYAVAWGTLALILLAAHRIRPQLGRIVEIGGFAIIAASMIATVFGAVGVLNPLWHPTVIGSHVVFNALLYFYGAPTLLYAAVAALRYNERPGGMRDVATVLSLALPFVMLSLLVRHGFYPTQMNANKMNVYEAATYTLVWGIYATGLLAALRLWSNRIIDFAGIIISLAAIGMALIGCVGVLNPLWEPAVVPGTYVFNSLLYLYGVPAVLCGAILLLRRDEKDGGLHAVAALACLAFTFVLISMQVRQAFWGPDLIIAHQPPTHAEWYSYSAAWLCFAAALLVGGILSRSAMLRYASLAVMLTAVVKVFVFDTRHLEDLWRVVSFLGLGVSLMLLAWVYQRFVFRIHRKSEPAAQGE